MSSAARSRPGFRRRSASRSWSRTARRRIHARRQLCGQVGSRRLYDLAAGYDRPCDQCHDVPQAALRFGQGLRADHAGRLLAAHAGRASESACKTVEELVAFLKANSGKSTYASAGSGTANQIAAEILTRSAGVSDVVHVPYKGSTPSAQAVLANEVNFSFLSMPPAVANVKAGKMRALAVTSAKRVGAAPDVPTLMESGFPNFELVVYSGILAPAGTPPAIISRLNAEFAKAVATDDVKTVFARIGAEGLTNSPEAFRALMESDIRRLGAAGEGLGGDRRLKPDSRGGGRDAGVCDPSSSCEPCRFPRRLQLAHLGRAGRRAGSRATASSSR